MRKGFRKFLIFFSIAIYFGSKDLLLSESLEFQKKSQETHPSPHVTKRNARHSFIFPFRDFTNFFHSEDHDHDHEQNASEDIFQRRWKEMANKQSETKVSQTNANDSDFRTSQREENTSEKETSEKSSEKNNLEKTNKSKNSASENWETELNREIEAQKEIHKKYENARNFQNPTQNNPLTADRSIQNLMMDLSAAVDIVGQWDTNRKQTTSNSLDIREAEFGFTAAVDQFARGNLLVAAHNENGRYNFEIHEANILFPFLSKYVNVKLGHFFLDVGRLNRIHRHDWNFTFAPVVHDKLMDREALSDTGAEFSFLFPFWKKITTELVLGVTNGRVWGHAHNAGVNKNNPMMYAHLKNFAYLGNNWGTQFGFTAMRYELDPITKSYRLQYGIDHVIRWNQSMLKSFILMSEIWYRENRFADSLDTVTFQKTPVPMDTQWGYYIFADYQFHQQWHAGYRYDFFNIPNLRDSQGQFARNAVEGNTLQVMYKPSEFSYLRASVERRYTANFSTDNTPEFIDWRYYVQTTFIMGSHPAHQY